MKFKEIAAAYEVLSSPEKKSHYDRFGSVDDNAGGFRRGEHVDPFDLFQAFFGGAHPDLFEQMGARGGNGFGGIHFANFGGHHGGVRFQQRAPPRTVATIQVSLDDLYKGGKRKVNNEEIEIKRGMKSGERVKGERNEYMIQELVHANFTRNGDDLVYTAIVSFTEWLLTGKSEYIIKHIDGTSSLTVSLKPILDVFFEPSVVVKNKGMPRQNFHTFGDLHVYSSFLSKSSRQQIYQLIKAVGSVIIMILVMLNPSLLFLVLLVKPLLT